MCMYIYIIIYIYMIINYKYILTYGCDIWGDKYETVAILTGWDRVPIPAMLELLELRRGQGFHPAQQPLGIWDFNGI